MFIHCLYMPACKYMPTLYTIHALEDPEFEKGGISGLYFFMTFLRNFPKNFRLSSKFLDELFLYSENLWGPWPDFTPWIRHCLQAPIYYRPTYRLDISYDD